MKPRAAIRRSAILSWANEVLSFLAGGAFAGPEAADTGIDRDTGIDTDVDRDTGTDADTDDIGGGGDTWCCKIGTSAAACADDG
jgi:hypothetical protein